MTAPDDENPDLTFLHADLRPHVAALDAAVALLIANEGYIDVDRQSPPADWRDHALAGCIQALRAAGWTVEPPGAVEAAVDAATAQLAAGETRLGPPDVHAYAPGPRPLCGYRNVDAEVTAYRDRVTCPACLIARAATPS